MEQQQKRFWMKLERKRFFLCLAALVGALLMGIVVGYAVPFPEDAFPRQDVLGASTVMQDVRNVRTFRVIFFNNTRVFLLMAVGILTGGLVSLGEAFVIGYMVGVFSKIAAAQSMPVPILLAALAPHGLFELTSFMTVGALGLYFASRIYQSVKGQVIDWTQEVILYAKVAAACYIVLFVAAVIEVYVTPTILHHLIT